MAQHNLAVVRAYYDAFNAHDAAQMARLMSPDVIDWDLPPGRDRLVQSIADSFTRFSDARLDPKEFVADSDKVAVRSVYSGTHDGVGRIAADGGQMVDVSATGKRFAVLHIDIWTLRGGRIVARHARGDDASMLMQLGLIPANPVVAHPFGLDDAPIDHRNIAGAAAQRRTEAAIRANMAALNGRDLDGFLSAYAVDARNHGRPAGREGFGLVIADIFRTYTPLSTGDGIVEIVAADDVVVARLERRLRHTGMSTRPIDGAFLMGREPTGREFTQRHIHWWTFRDGLIVDHRACRDDVGMAVALGLLPAPPT